ncbi:dihydrouridine synthase-domain-containing protein [Lasiosphaeris hirsuta]|uniref:tRNA-dihydrouridine(16/17) synthase [NAD(P)(+)] n=1 Tax=Lasiosphaeris hirsuta TaxID=260670 RepID=A0AA40DPS4_9PEZI|nr:dihydrouridine synthase-domain-containing protein [Lasiosphaeris hirsuta]
MSPMAPNAAVNGTSTKKKLHGRAFYESIGSPKYILAPMVDQSEFAWRMLSRSFLPQDQRTTVLAYTPMFHARLFAETQKYRDQHFQPTREVFDGQLPEPGEPPLTPWLDGNPAIDRPLFVQFCANEAETLLEAARFVVPYCDAVDLNLGCPQGIARKGFYGAFLQEKQDLIYELINTLHRELPVPVTAKIRILDTKEATLEYAQNVLRAGASILTVHGRRREQKGHLTGLADWEYIRYLREQLPSETVLFANGNILEHGDIDKCIAATGVDGVMSAEGNLSDPGIFAAPPPVGQEGREYWRGKDGKGGWRVDAVFRRYMDIVHSYARGTLLAKRRELFVPGDDTAWLDAVAEAERRKEKEDAKGRPPKRPRRDDAPPKKFDDDRSPNIAGMQAHLFHLLRHFVTRHTDVRDALARARLGDIPTFEAILSMVERKVAEGLIEYERTSGKSIEEYLHVPSAGVGVDENDPESSVRTVRECKRPWWVVQPIVRPLPKEALAKGAIRDSKKVRKQKEKEEAEAAAGAAVTANTPLAAAVAKVAEVVDQNGSGDLVKDVEMKTNFPSSDLVSG